MNVTASEIVLHIEEKLPLLRQAADRGEEDVVKEVATEISAYCQLLKGTAKRTKEKEMPMIISSPSPVRATPATSTEGEGEGSLFDF